MPRRVGFTLALILAFTTAAQGQSRDTVRAPAVLADTGDAVLWGIVRDEATGNPVPGLMITIDSTNVGAITDSAGRYVIHHVDRTGKMRWFRVRTGRGSGLGWFEEIREMRMFWPDDGVVYTTRDGAAGTALRRSFTERLDFWIRRFRLPF